MKRAYAALVAGALASGCMQTAAEPVPQSSGHVALPDFALTGDPLRGLEEGGSAFRGSVVLLQPDAPVTGLASLSVAARETRLKKAAWKAIERSRVAPVAAEAAALAEAYAAAERVARANSGDAQRAAARAWLLHRIEAAGVARESARALAEAYCEAKVWELAVSSQLTTLRFRERPSPFIGCEDYFDKAGLFAGDPRCAAAPEGASYFACIWHAGVFRTTLFKARYDEPFAASPSERKDSKLAAWIDDGTIEGLLPTDKGPQLKRSFMTQTRLQTTRVLGAAYRDAFVPKGGTPATAPDMALAAATPAMLVAALEDGPLADTPRALRVLPDAPLDDAEVVTLHKEIRALAARVAGEPSVADHLFGSPLAPLPEPPALAPLRTDPAFAFIFDAIFPEDRARLAAIARDQAATDAELASRKKEADAALALFTKALKDGAAAATQPGVGKALWVNALLRLARHPTGAIEVEFTLDDGVAHFGHACLDASTLAAVPCPDHVDATPRFPARASYDDAATRLEFVMPLEDPSRVGFKLGLGGPAGDGEPFGTLTAADLRGLELALELYPRRLGENFDYYSGKIVLRDEAGAVAHEGGVNLLAD